MTESNLKNYKKLLEVLICNECGNDMKINNNFNRFQCKKCKNFYEIHDGIIRCVPNSDWYNLNSQTDDITEKTKNYFGFEWSHFSNWGFIAEDSIKGNKDRYYGGYVRNRIEAFNNKCRLKSKDLENKFVLDAGCGNGRYTYEAGIRSKNCLVIGVDIGYGSVQSAFKNNSTLDNVLIIQSSLFKLPFRNCSIDSCFSNGVLMHTGNAELAFNEISRTIKKEGIFVAHLYGKLNCIWEFNDLLIRFFTTRLSIKKNIIFAKVMSKISTLISKMPYGFFIANLFLRIQSTEHHMFDWYSAPVATHHTYRELSKWYKKNGFIIMDNLNKKINSQEKVMPWKLPWAINLKGKRSNIL